jgi:hypothetical protein
MLRDSAAADFWMSVIRVCQLNGYICRVGMRKGGHRTIWHILRHHPTLAGGTVGTDDSLGHQQY